MRRTALCRALASAEQDGANAQFLLAEYKKNTRTQSVRSELVSRQVMGLFYRWKKEGSVGTETLKMAIKLLAKHDLDQACFQVWEAGVRAEGLQLDRSTYNTLIRITATAGNLEALKQVWKEMRVLHAPTSGTLHSFSRCLMKKGYQKVAYDAMVASVPLVKHDDGTMKFTLRAASSPREAFTYLATVLRGPQDLTKEVYVELVRVAARLGQTMIVEVLCRTSSLLGHADRETWNLLLAAYAQDEDWAGCRLVWARMLISGAQPDAVQACTYLRCCSYHLSSNPLDRNAVSEAEDAFAEQLSPDAINNRLLTAMMKVYAVAKLPDSGLSLYRWLRRHNVKPTEPFLQQARLILNPRDIAV
ncbi:hypothetical protein DIPPA_26506 [Diplonema papillatum]|nr:hypothetical protein DIPPA_34623 [Diplonema papillatum]KAJ9436514.1 hypothetical protein DIPPA_03827 [Diplonema papillatum]KAJ9442079.1 hypothetical protein DIPPA_26736 [Diplonema papillatum]KAJ9460720.1 hypothetical protein DIPPA_26506 [Diplonema papillatum]